MTASPGGVARRTHETATPVGSFRPSRIAFQRRTPRRADSTLGFLPLGLATGAADPAGANQGGAYRRVVRTASAIDSAVG
jgi:hypothetical protein